MEYQKRGLAPETNKDYKGPTNGNEKYFKGIGVGATSLTFGLEEVKLLKGLTRQTSDTTELDCMLVTPYSICNLTELKIDIQKETEVIAQQFTTKKDLLESCSAGLITVEETSPSKFASESKLNRHHAIMAQYLTTERQSAQKAFKTVLSVEPCQTKPYAVDYEAQVREQVGMYQGFQSK